MEEEDGEPGRIADDVSDQCGSASNYETVRWSDECASQSASLRAISPRSISPDEKEPAENEEYNGVLRNSARLPHDFSVCDGFNRRVRSLTADMLSQRTSTKERPKYGTNGQALMIRVRMFFDELKALLGPTCKGTVFDSPTVMAAAACGVSVGTIVRIGNDLRELGTAPQKRRNKVRGPREERLAVLKRYGDSINTLLRDLKSTDPEFNLSKSTLYRLVRGLGFSYNLINGKRYIYECSPDSNGSDHMGSNSGSGSEEEESKRVAKEENFVDEAWLLESMDKIKDDETAPCYVFRPAKSTNSNDVTGDRKHNHGL
ncbi:hypothetical protein GCK32_007651 [Trichostrongylus colubriformis]|uniref:Uncharacterized protein n=1 Tax=Trichostrongylus colubriformis TaxID=6319 RepID=A0AAN8J3B3_TRICO